MERTGVGYEGFGEMIELDYLYCFLSFMACDWICFHVKRWCEAGGDGMGANTRVLVRENHGFE